MPEAHSYDYAVVRVVPRVHREEFLNAGVILSCEGEDFLEARIDLDRDCLLRMDPGADLPRIEKHLESIVQICAGGPGSGPIGALSRRARYHWLTALRSSMIQTSLSHMGFTEDASATLHRLTRQLVSRDADSA
ncbi:hypothetical protein Poly30_19110 [Planctomycetes bacterium Poly30]|uniref:DUF3037 domain-containing protein n=1 Tax=Saltatorellus ferox TaxID=2528018 RepID=A0A518EQN9_9BACT|nr:hypothetical protein Poly30_19110 [Planctomycetes bacterium Poly30]